MFQCRTRLIALNRSAVQVALGAQSVSLVFHNRYAQHPAHRWLRRLVAETARRPDVT